MKVVINNCYGGFGLSGVAKEAYLSRIGKSAFFYEMDYANKRLKRIDKEKVSLFCSCYTKDLGDDAAWGDGSDHHFHDSDIERNDENLIAVIEELGSEAASGQCAQLKIVEIPDGVEYEISEYDGNEHIAEAHRTWS